MEKRRQDDSYILAVGERKLPLELLAAVISGALILLITLYPYNFEDLERIRIFPQHFQGLGRTGLIGPLVNAPLTALAERIGSPIIPTAAAPHTEFIYALLNVVLFLPLGFSLASLFRRKGYTWLTTFFLVQLLGSGLSLFVEITQTSIPSRNSTVIDLLTNSMGTFLGFLGFQLWKERAALRSIWSTRRVLATGFMVYLMVILIPSMYSAYAPHFWSFSNWSSDFHLLIGNEKTGDRPWHGNVSQLSIFDRALSESEVETAFSTQHIDSTADEGLLASYRFASSPNYPDETGSLPPLVWTPSAPNDADEATSVNRNHWLQTETSTAYLAHRIRETGEFTIDVTFTPADATQGGPARIVSYSGGTDQRNFTLGQSQTDLILRVRNPFTGANASAAEYTIPDLLSANRTYRVVATYSRDTLKIYVDDIAHISTVDFTPETKAVWFLAHLIVGRLTVDLSKNAPLIYALWFYILLLLPLGILIGAILVSSFRRSSYS